MIDITVSQEMAQNLHKAGWRRAGSYFRWTSKKGKWSIGTIMDSPTYGEDKLTDDPFLNDFYAAPTAEEILRELPMQVTRDRKNKEPGTGEMIDTYHLQIKVLKDNIVRIFYRRRGICFGGAKRTSSVLFFDNKDTLANALAAMWIFLKKSNFLSDE